MKLQVMKVGGTSVGDAECIARAAEIIASAARTRSVVAVVSAMSGVTNRLIAAAHQAATGDQAVTNELATALSTQQAAAIDALIKDESRHLKLLADVEQIIREVAALCRGTALLRELTPRTLAAISSAGERLSARLVAGAVCELGLHGLAVEATELIVTEDDSAQAEPLMEETRERAQTRLSPLLKDGVLPVVTGFIGASAEGILTTLGRGGSDYSATILGAAL